MPFKIQNLAGLCLVLALAARLLTAQPADLVLRNTKLITLDPANPQARALAARGGKIVAIGTNQQMQLYIGGSTKVIDLGGRLAIPGFIEGHGHFMSLGSSKMVLSLRDAKNWDQIVAMVAAAAREAKPGSWILGRGWHQAKWDPPPSPNVEGFPIHDQLSKVSPHNPVWLEHASGHAGFANAEAMRLAGIDKNTPDPSGGQILKDQQGNPIGLMNEGEQSPVRPRIGCLSVAPGRLAQPKAEACSSRCNWRCANRFPKGSRLSRTPVLRWL